MYVFGNGGSAALANHIASDLIRRPPIRVRSLCSNPALLTALANDLGYERVFAEQLRALLVKGDVVLAISASGRSKNVLRGLTFARRHGATCLGLTGKGGKAMAELCHRVVSVDSADVHAVENGHLIFMHAVIRILRKMVHP